jgi:hypothetical protein
VEVVEGVTIVVEAALRVLEVQVAVEMEVILEMEQPEQ